MAQSESAALVTASAKRLGKAISLKLADLGFDIALHYNSSKQDAELVKKEIESKGRKCHLFQADLAKVDSLSSLIESVYSKMPALSLLINSASIFDKVGLIDSSLEDFENNFAIHLRAPYILARDFAKYCKKGQIINIVDANIAHCKTNYFPYLLSKKALFQFTEMAACELAPQIRVNAIAPGLILPPPGEEHLNKKDNLLEHPASIDDLTLAIEYLVENNHVTGQCLFVDGGDHLIRIRQKQITVL